MARSHLRGRTVAHVHGSRDAIDDAFARWDRSHPSMLTPADGRVIADEETGAEMAGSIRGPITAPIDIAAARVARTVEPGAEFQFTFDLGDVWTRRCVVGEVKVDPLEVLGIRPDSPCRTGAGAASRTSMGADGPLRERLERAIEGKGAFSRFRDLVHGENLTDRWHAFSTDRHMGRAREFLADHGIRVG